ncbi:MAG: polymerase, sigma-24 subunit, subfamily [Acidimicrobiales bacterium]|nr:polymerase, sigma-24 subunit, subfamily [Acidimicrobiales bacterium]
MDAGDVYQRLGPAVYGYLRGQHVEDVEDLLGEVFFQVARSLATFEGNDDDLRRWVFTIARNRVVDDRRRRSRRPRTAPGPPPDAAGADEDRSLELVEMLGSLTDDQREIIALRFIADLPLATVAEMTGRTLGAVKSLQHRALEQLSRQLREDPTGDADG